MDITRGQVFNMLEQGIAVAAAGHGISTGDLALCANAIDERQLVLPFKPPLEVVTRITSSDRKIPTKRRRCRNSAPSWKAGCQNSPIRVSSSRH
ncbi:hypothetical protein [Paraburkholderia sp. UCT70]|uniref:hypothetical protein n=1 Tax=Paraburkholderia sp. UCT70 TaxID=2991068 RepID=UPI003D19FBA3